MRTIRILKQEQEIRELQSLVFDVYCIEHPWLDPLLFPNNRVVDFFDDKSVFIGVYEDNIIIAGFRLVYYSELGFPHQSIFDEKFSFFEDHFCFKDDYKSFCEITRMASRAKYRGNIIFYFLNALLYFGDKYNIKNYFMVVDENLFNLCIRIKVPLVSISESIVCEGSMSTPCLLCVKDFKEEINLEKIRGFQIISDKRFFKY